MSGPGVNLKDYFKVEVIGKDKKVYEDKYLQISHEEGKLKIYDVDRDYNDKELLLWKELKLNFISQVRDARVSRPKVSCCFCITHAGDEIFVQAESQDVMRKWIDELNGANKIIVPHVAACNLKPANSRNEVAGGVIVPVSQTPDSGDESPVMPALSMPSIYSGYAVKQGGMRKNWKRRYFLLNEEGLEYYKDDQEKDPIKIIPLVDMTRARKVAGEHHPHRTYLFEVITTSRTFNIQCETDSECENWVCEINKLVDNQPPPCTEKTNAPKKASDTKMMADHSTKKYNLPPAQPVVPHDPEFLRNLQQKQQELKRSSNEEETVCSNSVWNETKKQREVDRKSKTSLKMFSPKSWTLW